VAAIIIVHSKEIFVFMAYLISKRKIEAAAP